MKYNPTKKKTELIGWLRKLGRASTTKLAVLSSSNVIYAGRYLRMLAIDDYVIREKVRLKKQVRTYWKLNPDKTYYEPGQEPPEESDEELEDDLDMDNMSKEDYEEMIRELSEVRKDESN